MIRIENLNIHDRLYRMKKQERGARINELFEYVESVISPMWWVKYWQA